AHTVRTVIRRDERPFDLYFHLAAIGSNIRWQNDLHAGIADHIFQISSDTFCVDELNRFYLVAGIKHLPAAPVAAQLLWRITYPRHNSRTARILAEQVLIKLHPDKTQLLRAVIGISQNFGTGNLIRLIIQMSRQL